MSERRHTSTSNFGVGRRESHDASAFYSCFEPPELLNNSEIAAEPYDGAAFICGDSRHMDDIADNCVALVVTSPPYFVGKQYEEELGNDGVPLSMSREHCTCAWYFVPTFHLCAVLCTEPEGDLILNRDDAAIAPKTCRCAHF